jgi:hypothetical protein
MFIQVIQGHVTDRTGVYDAFESWVRQLAPGAEGWLGTTAGVTDDDELIALVRFESEDAAQRNSHRPEQHQWWMDTSKLFAGDATFHDSTEIDTMLEGGSDEAGFVQVIQGRTSDPARLRELNRRSEEPLRQHRPDIIGGTIALHDTDRVTEAVYFTSEPEAREGERKAMPPEVEAVYREEQEQLRDQRYLDLNEPWLYSPAR